MIPPEPRANPDLVGHDEAARSLEEAARATRLHHAWLITGPVGVGKATLAYRFARWLLAGQPPAIPGQPPLAVPESHPAFRRIAAGAHADLFTMAPNTGDKGKKEILRADDARAAVRFLAHTAAEGGWRVIVVEELDRAEREVVPNILLKTLEEPPPRTIQLIVTSQPGALLPTIRSRCRRLDLYPLPGEAMDGLLARWLPELPAAERGGLLRIADGSPGRALALAEGEGLALQAVVEEVLRGLPQLDPRVALDVADRVAARRETTALGTFFALLRRALSSGLREAGKGGDQASWLAGRSLADWATVWDKLGLLADETERLNLDRKQAVLTGLGLLSVR
jgi:DNA polymerase-3 subunit delta'